ncbi:unnamed protein product [Rotaria magnacalcarata]|uniref:Uncharacterized protein n=1 Tax=Rotaria magnacalcarata TaxID=392030 RepID=A0A820HG68_9BILA|nr:unnamed protein product [Rotaria magnacalcarata]CAF4293127.1 unnamed protein product [Rotaria magnacalcarata]
MSFSPLNISLVEGQCLAGKLPDTVNVAIQIDGTQVHERYATKQNDFDEKRIRIISKSLLNQEILATSRIYSSETSVIQTLQYHHPIIHVQLNQLINYFDPRPEYIRAIFIEWSTESSISIARIISADIQCSLLSARRRENFDDYSQQVD